MHAVYQEAVNLLGNGQQVVVATVVRTKGSTPQKPGAKLLVRDDGSGVGTLGGGCVEGDIWFAAKELMSRGGPTEHRDYQLNEELAAQDGLVCGGTMYFLIDPIYQPGDYLPYAQEIEKAYQGGPGVVLATLVKPTQGSTATTGSKLFIRDDGTVRGTLGSDQADRQAAEKARELLAQGRNEYATAEDGAEYFIEAYTTPPQLVLCGGGHVSKAIAPLAKTLGFRIFVTDDRLEFADEERFPEADGLVALSPEEALPQLPINANSSIVIVTRGHRYDDVALKAALDTPASYVGLMGSKRKTVLIYEDLLHQGVPVDSIRRVRAPIGLDIHARTPEEIAVSIIGEILMFRLGGTGRPLKLEDRHLQRLLDKVREPVAVAD